MLVTTLILVVLLSFPTLICSILLHELGHVVAARLTGLVPTSFGMGTGRVFFACSLFGVRFFLGARQPLHGFTFFLSPRLRVDRWRLVCNLSGGIAANSLIAVVAYGISPTQPLLPVIWRIVTMMNAVLALTSLVPSTVRAGAMTFSSDGYAILRAIFGTAKSENPGVLLTRVRGLTELWTGAGDWRALHAATMQAAAIWLELGDIEHAKELRDAACSMPAEPLPLHRAIESLIGGLIALSEDDLDAAAAGIACAEALFQQSGDSEGSSMVVEARQYLLEKRFGVKKATAHIQTFETPTTGRSDGAPESESDSVNHSWSAGRADQAAADRLRAAYEATPVARRTALLDLRVSSVIARACAGAGKAAEAASAYACALRAVVELDKSFAPCDRLRFRAARAELIAAAQANLRDCGRPDEAARLDRFFQSLR